MPLLFRIHGLEMLLDYTQEKKKISILVSSPLYV